MSDTAPTVLFVCVHNAGRSQMAAAWLEHLARGRVRVLSGGSLPAAAGQPRRRRRHGRGRASTSRPAPRSPGPRPPCGRPTSCITMGCGDTCPFFPGKRYEDWAVADPAGRPLEEVRAVRDDIEERVRRLVEELGIGLV